MKEHAPQTKYLKDYQPLTVSVDKIDLKFQIFENKTLVTAVSEFVKNPKATHQRGEIFLSGEFFNLISLALNGQELSPSDYILSNGGLTLKNVTAPFQLKVVSELDPAANKSLEGLYKSGEMYCTQNEAEGFRRITYYLDRPDNMAIFSTTIEADKKHFPILLSNGNLVSHKDLEDGRHQAVWADPYRKPCYLFALVAGDLAVVEDQFITASGRKVKLQIYVDHGNESRCQHAMDSLKASMKWDEERFHLEYDLDIYMIVAANAFNSGAMENKGLNIFNAKYVLANRETATDRDYHLIESIIGHEYFHNWSGNRVTCRDWFQLSLKEGFTVFRDQEFSADLHSHAVKRIEDVSRLRTFQFAEDAGPMAHPVRPASYMEVNNFYTLTVYEKGAEVVRMLQTLLGRETFNRGVDKYFELFDGQAVTTDDFVFAMEQASGEDLTQFKRWYDQAGTPEIRYTEKLDSANKTYSLTLEQSCAPTPGQKEKLPFYMPISLGLINQAGREIPLTLVGEEQEGPTTRVLVLKEQKETFTFKNIAHKPYVSILREFSAPVRIMNLRSNEELMFLMKNDLDAFCRWEASQTLALQTIQALVEQTQKGTPAKVDSSISLAFGDAVKAFAKKDPAYAALLLSLPTETYIAQNQEEVDPYLNKACRDQLIKSIGTLNRGLFEDIFASLKETGHWAQDTGIRNLKGILLQYFRLADPDLAKKLALELYKNAQNMTHRLNALNVINNIAGSERDELLADFYEKFKGDTITIDKWINLQALSELDGHIQRLESVTKDPVFDYLIPNKSYALFSMFGNSNVLGFHQPSGDGYRYMADQILKIDKHNPSVAARLVSMFNQWKKFEPKRQGLMKKEIERMVATPGLSENTFEIVSKALK